MASALLVVFAVQALDPPAAWSAAWSVGLQAASRAQAKTQAAPAAPAASAACVSSTSNKVQVSWGAVTHAATYTVHQSSVAATGPYTSVATVTAPSTSWTSGALVAGSYWFEVTANIGTNWSSAASAATAQRTISTNGHCA